MTTLDQIAPYPKTEAEVTADALARSFAVHAQLHWRMAIDHPDPDQARQSALWVGQYFTITFLLLELKQRAGNAAADEAARNLWAEIDAVASIGGWVWNWLDGYGINQAKVNDAIDALMAENAAATNRLDRELTAAEQQRADLAAERDALADHLAEIADRLGIPATPGQKPVVRWVAALEAVKALTSAGVS